MTTAKLHIRIMRHRSEVAELRIALRNVLEYAVPRREQLDSDGREAVEFAELTMKNTEPQS